MMPFIVLSIQNNIPSILFNAKDGSTKRLNLKDENIKDEIINLAEKLNLTDKNLNSELQLEVILEMASEGDYEIVDEIPQFSVENLEFNLHDSLKKVLDSALSIESEYASIEMNEVVRLELDRIRKVDILSGLINQLYNIIIAKTLLSAFELEINEIHFKSNNNYARLIEKMGSEIQKLGLEFIIE